MDDFFVFVRRVRGGRVGGVFVFRVNVFRVRGRGCCFVVGFCLVFGFLEYFF